MQLDKYVSGINNNFSDLILKQNLTPTLNSISTDSLFKKYKLFQNSVNKQNNNNNNDDNN